MKRNLIIFCSAIFITVLAAGCVKVIDKFNSNTISVTFNAPGPLYLTTDKTVNPKDSIQFSYSVTCPTAMTNVTLVKNGTVIATDSVKTPGKLTFSGIKKIVADSVAGQYVYQVIARDNTNIYLGTSATITVTVTPDFMYYVGRRLFVPDTATKTNPCFINLASSKTYSYSDITSGNNSAQVDLGFFFSTDTVNTASSSTATPIKTVVGPTFFALNSTPVTGQRNMYDLSTWTKNATVINVGTSPTFANLQSTGWLKSGGLTNLKTNNYSVPVYTPGLQAQSSFKAVGAGTVIYFKTVGGKYGAINVLYVNQSSAAHGTYVNFDYKIQN